MARVQGSSRAVSSRYGADMCPHGFYFAVVQQLLLVLTIGGVLNAMDEVMSFVERKIPDELCNDNTINTGTNDHAVIVDVAVGSYLGAFAVQEELPRRS